MNLENYEIIQEFDVKQIMRDGVKLSSYIYRPESKFKFPVILTRTPYSTIEGHFKRLDDEAKFFAKHGYVYIIQDCRGKNNSEGKFNPFHNDNYDGYDTIKWILHQKWSDGNIGTIGASYSAWNQWATAVLNPPGLKTMISIVALPDPIINVPYQNGALVLPMAEWMAIIEGKTNLPSEIYDTQNLLWHLPLSTMDRKFGWKSSIWKDWLNHSSSDEFWKETFYQDKLKNIHIPVLHISGWYDDDLIGTYINFSTISNNISLDQKNYQKLIIGPWQHKVNRSQKIGDIDFGNSAIIDLRKIELDWFDRFLKGINNGIDNDLPVEIFVMGENKWRKEKTFPIENTKYIPYYIHSNGKANSSEGDGTLNIKIPDDEPYDQYIYDPSDPVRCILDPNDISAEGPFDQSSLERKKDVLVYQTDVLKEEIEVTGPIKMRLYVSSDAIDTDFWVQLTDVFPTGYSMHLTENIIRCGYRFGFEKFIPLKPNEITECNVDLWAISNLFKKGHKIRIDISSSCFPKYNRNPNTGESIKSYKKLKKATQRIYHNNKYPSYVLLSIIKR